MDINKAFGSALKEVRKNKGISQEKLNYAASRVYVSSLERGLKSPTLSTINKLSSELGIHPLSLLILAYSRYDRLAEDDIVFLLKNTLSLMKSLESQVDD